MCGRPTFDRDVLTILLMESAVELGHDRYDPKLSNDAPLVSVSSFCEELCSRQSLSWLTGFQDFSNVVFIDVALQIAVGRALRVSPAVTWLAVYRLL